MSQPQKKFAKLRQWNRRRNYYFKALRMRLAKLCLDYRSCRPLTLDTVKKVLLLRDDGKIGDMVVSTSLLREFSVRGYIIDVLATPENFPIVENNPYIRKVFINNTKDISKQLSQENYDAVIDMGDKISPKSLYLLRTIKANNVIGFNKKEYKIYNKSIPFQGYNEHISKRYSLLMTELGFKNYSVDYELHICDHVHEKVSEYLKSLPGKYNFVINPFTASKERDLEEGNLQKLVNELHKKFADVNIILIGLPERMANINIEKAFVNPHMSIQGAMSLIYQCDIIISPDTSVVHIAAVWKKPLVALYGNDTHGMFNNNDVWGPGYNNAIQITSIDKYHSVSTIPILEILKAVDVLFIRRD